MHACFYHEDRAAVGICMRCRRPICAACTTRLDGVNHCHQCLKELSRRSAEPGRRVGLCGGFGAAGGGLPVFVPGMSDLGRGPAGALKEDRSCGTLESLTTYPLRSLPCRRKARRSSGRGPRASCSTTPGGSISRTPRPSCCSAASSSPPPSPRSSCWPGCPHRPTPSCVCCRRSCRWPCSS